MADYNSEFREFLKEIHAYYSRERNLRDVGGLNFQRVKDIAKSLLEYGNKHKELLQDILDHPEKYPFNLFGVDFKDGEISAPTLGWSKFKIQYRRRRKNPSDIKIDPKKYFFEFTLSVNPG